MGRGILRTISLAGTFVVVAPVVLLAVQMLLGGNPMGFALLGAAGAMLFVAEQVTRPSDVPGDAAERVASVVVSDDDE
jgi:hypothetical protein